MDVVGADDASFNSAHGFAGNVTSSSPSKPWTINALFFPCFQNIGGNFCELRIIDAQQLPVAPAGLVSGPSILKIVGCRFHGRADRVFHSAMQFGCKQKADAIC